VNSGQPGKQISTGGYLGSGSETLADTVFQSDDFLSKRYDLVRRIGRGGMSAVYLAHDRQLDRQVAVKVMLPFDDEEAETFTIRFVNEARILARLNHPNIVHVYDFAATESGLRIIMEYVEGRTLYQRVADDGAMDEVEVAAIACEVLDALDVIHTEDVIHRDIKPGNVMLDGRGRVKVMDFGIAMTDAQDEDRTTESSVVGTMKFMAPEQANAETVSPRTDLFSVGATMAFCLLGNLPSVLRPQDLPPRLRSVLVRAMAADPAQRFASALEMQQAIEHAIRSQPPVQRKPKKRRSPLLIMAALGVCVGLFLAALLLVADLVLERALDRPPPPVTPPAEVLGEDDVGIVIEDEAVIEDAVEDAAGTGEIPSPGDPVEPAVDPAEAAAAPDPMAPIEEAPTAPPVIAPPADASAQLVEQVVAGPPSIKHLALDFVDDGDPARFEVRVVGDLTYEVFVNYRSLDGGSWRNVELRYRGNELYTGTLRLGGAYADGFVYYVSVLEQGGQSRVFSRGSTDSPYRVLVR